MDAADKRELIAALEEKEYREAGRRFYRMFPDEGPLSRFNYPKQMEFFALGAKKPYRCLIGGNGTGKSLAGAYETTCHLTGVYPDWWTGKRYDHAINNWSAGVDFKSIRESMQLTLLGRRGQEGTGMIPRDAIVGFKYSAHDSLDYVQVKHVSGGISNCLIKCYEQGRESFQAANVDDIWLDEEPDDWQIYSECIQRFRGDTRDGHLRLTFTPLFGVTEVICMFVPSFMQGFSQESYDTSGRAYVSCTLDDVPHISPEEKARKIANTMAHEREARINGTPSIGEGKVYPFAEESFVIDPLPQGIPRHWPRLYGFDPGLRVAAAVWGALDPDSDTLYLYSEMYAKEQLPAVHAAAIKARGTWIPGMVDPASRGRDKLTGDVPLDEYKKLGLRLREADNTHDGIADVYDRFATGRIKVYRTLVNFLQEFRKYARDKNHRIIKVDDHAMDASRYLIRGLRNASLPHENANDRTPKMAEMAFY